MKRPVWVSLIAVVSTLLLVLLAAGFRQDPDSIQSPLVHHVASNFVLRTMDGNRTISLREFRGRPVVLNFFASWCTDCKIDHEYLARSWAQQRQRNVAFLSVLYQDSPSAARSFLRKYGGGWPVLRDPGGQTAVDYGVYGVPETFFIDSRGVVVYKATGPVSWDLLNAQILTLRRGQA